MRRDRLRAGCPRCIRRSAVVHTAGLDPASPLSHTAAMGDEDHDPRRHPALGHRRGHRRGRLGAWCPDPPSHVRVAHAPRAQDPDGSRRAAGRGTAAAISDLVPAAGNHAGDPLRPSGRRSRRDDRQTRGGRVPRLADAGRRFVPRSPRRRTGETLPRCAARDHAHPERGPDRGRPGGRPARARQSRDPDRAAAGCARRGLAGGRAGAAAHVGKPVRRNHDHAGPPHPRGRLHRAGERPEGLRRGHWLALDAGPRAAEQLDPGAQPAPLRDHRQELRASRD